MIKVSKWLYISIFFTCVLLSTISVNINHRVISFILSIISLLGFISLSIHTIKNFIKMKNK